MRVVPDDLHRLGREVVDCTAGGVEPRALPELRLDPACRSLDDFTPESVQVLGYDPHPAIRAPIAV